MKHDFVKINNETCKNLYIMNHCWHLKKIFEKIFKKIAWLMNWINEKKLNTISEACV